MFPDFALLPPEINSLRMYSGPGAAPLQAAATAWRTLATELHSAAASAKSVVTDLATSTWHGPSAAAMEAAVTPYLSWLSDTAVQAELVADEAEVAAGAYEAAFAATVPPSVVAANRALLAALVATNFLGVNSAAIAATEAHYAEMWGQDAAAMYGYAATAAAIELPPISPAPDPANPAGPAEQQLAVSKATATTTGATVTDTLARLGALAPAGAATANPLAPLNSALSSVSTGLGNLTGAYSPIGLAAIPGGWFLTALQNVGLAQNGPGVAALLGGQHVHGVLGPLAGGYISQVTPMAGAEPVPAVTASMGRATSLAGLSAPSSWASAATSVNSSTAVLPDAEIKLVASTAAAGRSALLNDLALSGLAGHAVGGSTARSFGGSTVRMIEREADADDGVTANILVIRASEA